MEEKITIAYVPVDQLKSAEYNPRTWTEFATEKLTEGMKKFGIVDPLVVNQAPGRENVVIGGHFRLKLARDMGLAQVPVVYVKIPNLDDEKELNVRLNKNTGEWDYKLLAKFDINLLKMAGFMDHELKLLEGSVGSMVLPDVQAGGAQTRSITVYYTPEIMAEVEEAINSHEGKTVSDKLLALIRSHPSHGDTAV